MRTFAVAPVFICMLGGSLAARDDLAKQLHVSPAKVTAAMSGPQFRVTSELDGPATPMDYGGCGPNARREPGLQGEIPLSAQNSGDSAKGYQCNVKRISSNTVNLRGNNFQLAYYKNCAYVSTIGTQAYTGALGEPDEQLDGIAAIDASDPTAPKLTDIVKSPVAKSSHEAIEVNAKRGLLVAELGGLIARYVEIYDVHTDCTHPKFLGRYDAGIPIFHGLKVSDDGNTFYASDTFGITGAGQMLHAVDIRDPTHPKKILTWDPLVDASPPEQYAAHDEDVSADGNRLYLGTAGISAAVGLAVGGPSNGNTPSLVILDSSDVQSHKPDPKLRVVSKLSLPNFGHTVQRMTIGGKPYLLVSGEAPVGGGQECPWAWGHIIDISDEKHPRRVSDLRLQVNQKRYCSQTSRDGGAIYSIHYVGVDSDTNTKLVFYTYYTGGLRIFDVTDPEAPREVGYYQPPPTGNTVFNTTSPITPDAKSSVLDNTTSVVRYIPERNQLWLVSVNSGFQVLQLTGKLGCGDRVGPPHGYVIRASLRGSRRGFSIRGRSFGLCATTTAAREPSKVTRVTISIGRVAGSRCRFLTSRGGFTAARSCRKPLALRVKGTSAWTFASKAKLAKGHYRVYVQATDASGRHEKLPARPNARFVVR
jgi:hypothetical protein